MVWDVTVAEQISYAGGKGCIYHTVLSLQGFKIIFEFSDNSYFSNKELVKTYYMVSDDAEDPVLQRATGTTIQWASGKNPGVKVSQNHLRTGRPVCVMEAGAN